MEASQEFQAAMIQLLSGAQLMDYLTVASITVVSFDYFISLSREVGLMWQKPLTRNKILYLVTRYFTLISMAFSAYIQISFAKSDSQCYRELRAQGVLSPLLLVVADTALAYRVWILFGLNKVVLAILVCVILSLLVTVTSLLNIYLNQCAHLPFLHSIPALRGCYSLETKVPTFFKLYMLVLLLDAFIMFALSAYKCVQTIYDNGWRNSPVITLFLRDGIVWFAAVLAIDIAQAVVNTSAKLSIVGILSIPTCAIYVITSTRLLLNMEEMISKPEVAEGDIPDTLVLTDFQANSRAGMSRQTYTFQLETITT